MSEQLPDDVCWLPFRLNEFDRCCGELEAGRTVLFWVIAGLQAPFSAPAEKISDQSLGHSLSTRLPSYRKPEPTP